jgi:phage terminase large subunit GpA-like protein
MDKLSVNDPVQEVVVIKGAQLGFTEAGNNWVGYIIDIAPGPTMMVQPTDETVKRNSKIRITPMIEATPRLREKIMPARSRDSSNTTYSKDFPGGVLVMTGANSAVGLRSMPVRYLFLDEIDGYPPDLDGEGSPLDLAKARTRTFAKKKIYMVSTPTVEGVSVIEKEFKSTDQRYFHVPCPHCGTYQHLKWSQLRWEEKKPETARYYCEHCNEAIEERFKPSIFADGYWKSTCEENASPHKVGYHINSLYSPFGWYSWTDAAREWEEAQGDNPKLKTFINTVLGETWKEKGEAPPWENLYNRRETYRLNEPSNEVVFITVGVDVQKDRLELEVVGWCRGKRSYSLDYRAITGDTSNPEVWNELAKVVGETWKRPDGITLPMRLMAVDTGYNTQHVYDFCKRFDVTRVIPIKGQDRQQIMFAPPKAVEYSSAGKKVGKVKVWNVGVSLIKSEVYGFLKLEKAEDGSAPNGYCHFPQYNHEYFRGLTAEQLQYKTNNRGFKTYEWVKKYDRNEPLDTRVYARAAAAVLGVDRFKDEHWAAMERENMPQTNQKQPAKKRSSFWDR